VYDLLHKVIDLCVAQKVERYFTTTSSYQLLKNDSYSQRWSILYRLLNLHGIKYSINYLADECRSFTLK